MGWGADTPATYKTLAGRCAGLRAMSVTHAPPGAPADAEPTVLDGIRVAIALFLPLLMIGASFGLTARELGWGAAAPIVMSILVYSGSAQFAAAGVVAAGGGAVAAVAAAALANLRFLPLGLVAAPATRGSALRRAAEGQAVVDASVAIATRGGTARVSRGLLLGSSIPQFAGWVGGTAIGAAAGLPIDPAAWGVDAVFPAFFLAVLAPELRRRDGRRIAAAGAAIALVLTPLTPPGLPVVVASVAAFLGVRR